MNSKCLHSTIVIVLPCWPTFRGVVDGGIGDGVFGNSGDRGGSVGSDVSVHVFT